MFKSNLVDLALDESDLAGGLARLLLSALTKTNEEKSLIQEKINKSHYKNSKNDKENFKC